MTVFSLNSPLAAAKPSKQPSRPAKASDTQKQLYAEGLRHIRNDQLDEALIVMENFAKSFPESELADNALYWMGEVYLQKNEISLARDEFSKVLRFYPKGDRFSRAQAQLAQIDGPQFLDDPQPLENHP